MQVGRALKWFQLWELYTVMLQVLGNIVQLLYRSLVSMFLVDPRHQLNPNIFSHLSSPQALSILQTCFPSPLHIHIWCSLEDIF